MSRRILLAPSIAAPIQPSPGFAKKALSDYKVDLAGRCEYDCGYCSSPSGRAMNVRLPELKELALNQFGEPIHPASEAGLSIAWPDVIDRLKAQLATKSKAWGTGKTLVASMLTDPLSPRLVAHGTTKAALDLIMQHTSFRVRVLTKNHIVGHDEWIEYFAAHRDRFVVGTSIGTLNDEWATQVERFTAKPSRRIEALHRLQDAGVPTYGMLCPVFPHVLQGDHLERLVEQHRPEQLEQVWCEPFNDRRNWRNVVAALPMAWVDREFMLEIYDRKNYQMWSRYATNLYVRLHDKLDALKCSAKLTYLLYEKQISPLDAARVAGAAGIMLQDKPDANGFSRNPAIAVFQVANES